MERPLEGKVVLVTGGGVRLGRAIAEGVGRAGARVAVHFNASQVGAQEAVSSIVAGGCQARTFQADLTDAGQIEPLVCRVEAELGPIAALVNSAAGFDRVAFLETPREVLDGQWALNARAPFLLTQAVARRMVGRGGGDVVNVLDIGGARVPWRNYSAYCMSKAALAMLTQCLALELAPAIRVNGVLPGTVLPPERTSPEELERLRERIPQRTFGSPRDVVEAVLFFLTGPRFITGQMLAVDGGRSLGTAGG
jgi:pteridine reductase